METLLDDTIAPDLLDAEVLHRLVRAEQGGALEPTQLDERLALLFDAPIQRVPCPLVTTDGRLARTATTQFGLTVTHVPTSGR